MIVEENHQHMLEATKPNAGIVQSISDSLGSL